MFVELIDESRMLFICLEKCIYSNVREQNRDVD